MANKQDLINALTHQPVKNLPWVPFAGVHAGRLIGKKAIEVLTNEDVLFESLLAVNKMYKPSGQPIMFDLQIEAEILGCELVWAEDGPPSVKTHPLEETMTVPCKCLAPKETDGRLPIALNVVRRLKEAVGDDTLLYATICGPFTLASHLRGNEIFVDMYDEDDYVKELLDFCTECAKVISDHYIKAGIDVVAVVDPLVSQISRDHFEEFLTAPYTEIFNHLRNKNTFSSFFVCGDATRNIESMCQTGPDSISVDENVDIFAAKKITDKYNVTIGGNIPLTSIMLHGTQQDNMKFVIDMIDKLEDTRNFIVAPGCDIPYDIPVENGIAIAQAIFETEKCREMLKNYVSVQADIQVDLPDYANLTTPLVEVFTLDSLTCAACTYMKGAVDAAYERLDGSFDMVEYKFTLKENIARCVKMGVKNLPCVYINGELKFSSLIPSPEQLDEAINAAK